MAVDREFVYILLCVYSFVICCSPLNVVGAHFAFLGETLASFWLPWDDDTVPLGRLGLPLKGLSLGSLWPPFAIPWVQELDQELARHARKLALGSW